MNLLKSLVYPVGRYHKKYTNYVGFSFLSNIIISAESVLSTHSMLHAVGANVDTGTIITANYIGKDIVGQVGGLFYIHRMGKSVDKTPLKFLKYSNILQQTAIVAECLTPVIGNYFLLIAGSANIAKNISFTGFGSINAQCSQRLATDNNIGEIYAKSTVINTIGSSIGMLGGLYLIWLIPDHHMRILLLPFLAFVRVYSMNKAVMGVL
jgi:hypothetical protein